MRPSNNTGVAWDSLSISWGLGCGITSQRLFCWGLATSTGRNGSALNLSPGEVTGGGAWSTVFANYYHACGIQTTGAMYCWVCEIVLHLPWSCLMLEMAFWLKDHRPPNRCRAEMPKANSALILRLTR